MPLLSRMSRKVALLTLPLFFAPTFIGGVASAAATPDKNSDSARVALDRYSQGGLKSCDEYPFASTYEGAANGNLRWSARVIDASDNSTSGARLGVQYNKQVILESDAFEVQIYSGTRP